MQPFKPTTCLSQQTIARQVMMPFVAILPEMMASLSNIGSSTNTNNDAEILDWDSSYKDQLTDWVKNSPSDNRDCYQAVANAILNLKRAVAYWTELQIDCLFLDSLPPLPACARISLVLKGEPDVPLEVFLAHLPSQVRSLTFCENDAIEVVSIDMFPTSVKKLHIENCSNFTHFVGKFAVKELYLVGIVGRFLSLLENNFPNLRELNLHNNCNLESVEVSKDFKLNKLFIRGDHNKLTAFPAFSGLNWMSIDDANLASISDYSGLIYTGKDSPSYAFDAVWLLENHHKQGKLAATLKLIEMAESILTGKIRPNIFGARHCLEALIGKSTASSACPEFLLGQLFLEGKFIQSDYQKAQNFFQLALDGEKDLTEKSVLEQQIGSLIHEHLYRYYQNVLLFSQSQPEIDFPQDLRHLIFSMGAAAIKGFAQTGLGGS